MAARFYVYRLIDPRDGSIFYVGKGQKDRILHHERDARKAEGVCSEKVNRIKDIWESNREVLREHVAYFWDEQAAYDFETDLIEEIGLANLTNIMPGGQKAWTRRVAERRERKPLTFTQVLRKWSDGCFQRIAEWLKEGGHKGVRWSFTAADPKFAFHAEISAGVYNQLLPVLWPKLVNDAESLQILKERLKPHGVELV
jgi:hypothetical protein